MEYLKNMEPIFSEMSLCIFLFDLVIFISEIFINFDSPNINVGNATNFFFFSELTVCVLADSATVNDDGANEARRFDPEQHLIIF